MKIVLSRKGFDAKNGGHASPILPDNTLLSLPIPYRGEIEKFSTIQYGEHTYLDIIKQLRPKTHIDENEYCHLDPDIRKSAKIRGKHWRPIFGQCDGPQTHLKRNDISVNDLFLFFGWFKQTEYKKGQLTFTRGGGDLHVLYGYLQIGELIESGQKFPEYTIHHAHSKPKFIEKRTNCMYVANEHLSFNSELPGAGCFKYSENLVLTKKNETRGRWELPDFFRSLSISHHTSESWIHNYFQTVDIGQEFVVEENEKVTQWAKDLIQCNIDLNGSM